MKSTRILYSKDLNRLKYNVLAEQAKLLGRLRMEVWQKYGSISGVGMKDRTIRDFWLKEKRNFVPLTANAWKETLRDTIADIALYQEAAKVKTKQVIRRHTSDKDEQKRLYRLLKSDKWTENKYLKRIMRKYYKHGNNHTYNQIIVRSDNYTSFQKNGKGWISIPSLTKGKRISIPLSSCQCPHGTLRIILANNKMDVHYSTDIEKTNDCGDKIIGIDKGFTETFVDSDGIHYGKELGAIISRESDYLKQKYQSRSKIFQIVEKSQPCKKSRIRNQNLGRKKLNNRKIKRKKEIRTIVFTAIHKLVDKAKIIVAEDLTAPMFKRAFGKNMNRKLSAWTKGVIAKGLTYVSQRRSSSLHLVNAAYTSQIDHQTGCFTGIRKGDQFYCENGEVYQADENAAKNVKARLYDLEISRWTNYKKVKSILLKRTDSHRMGLLILGSSCTGRPVSTESELLV